MMFFGCNKRVGHYLIDPTGRSYDDYDAKRVGWPTPSDLDGSRLFLPYPEQHGTGAWTYLTAPDVSVLAWWGNPFDTRGAVNNALLARGHYTEQELWAMFEKQFPDLAAQLPKPHVTRGVHE